jgi:cobalt/nickel transport system ATP-binding protein
MSPRILVVDEPTGDLDPSNSKRIEELLRTLRDQHGISVVIALHDLDMAARLADRVCIVKGGSILAEGKPAEILYDEPLLRSAGLEPPSVVRLFRGLGLDAPPQDRPLDLERFMRLVTPKKTRQGLR